MNRLLTNRSEWPPKGYVHQAIHILERINDAKGNISAIPMDCRLASWRFPQLIYDLLNWWTADERCRIALLGFPQSPATLMLGWLLEQSQMGRRELASLELERKQFPRIVKAATYLARRGILVQSAGFADASSFYAQVQRVAAEFGITRVLAHDCLLGSGRRLSESPIPQGWQGVSDFLDVEVVLCGRRDSGVWEKPMTTEPLSRGTVLVVDEGITLMTAKYLQQAKDHYFGNGGPKSYAKAFETYLKAAEAGHPEAQFHVALCFEDGDGVKQDSVQAVAWYRKSAVAGYAKAQNNLAVCYGRANGVPGDHEEAEKWYCLAADQGYAPTSSHEPEFSDLGRMGAYYYFKFDHGAPHDGVHAVRWYLKEAERGDADAQCNLGVCYEFGHRVPKDMVIAARWYRAAAGQNHPGALNKLVVGIRCGWISAIEADEQGKWYDRMESEGYGFLRELRKGAERGEAMYQDLQGIVYQLGRKTCEVPKDSVEAYKWRTLAEQQNFKSFLEKHPFAPLKASMTPEQIKEGDRRVREFKPIV